MFRSTKLFLGCAILVGGFFASAAAAQQVLHVNASAADGGDGASWAAAFNDLQNALDAARSNPAISQIWVAAGAYNPDRQTGDRELSFELVPGVELLGGFVGDERDESQRDPVANVTILSADLNGDDQPGFVNNDENTHVIVHAIDAKPAVTLDGFQVIGANNEREIAIGGGLWLESGDAVVRQCNFLDGVTQAGGGIFLSGGTTLTISDSSIVRSLAFNGAGLWVSEASVHATNCRFEDNETGFADPSPGCGGGVQMLRAHNAIFERCVFQDNGSFCGGGVSSVLSESITFRDCDFIGNVGHRLGGGLRLERSDDNDAQPTIIDGCRFIGNVNENPLFGGGAIYATETILKVTNCEFYGNDATQFDVVFNEWIGAGSVYVDLEVGHEFYNCVFSGNIGGGTGGLVLATLQATVANCTFANNLGISNNTVGCGLAAGGTVDVDNCIMWGNRVGDGLIGGQNSQVAIDSGSVDSSLIEDHVGGFGQGNIAGNPLFTDADGADDVLGTFDDDLRLSPGSPAVDAGDDDALPNDINDVDDDGDTKEILPNDLDGNTRVIPRAVDMGPYELQAKGCPWDLDGDGVVGSPDLIALLGAWGGNPGHPADFDGDGVVGAPDLIILLGNWGACS